MVKPISTQRLYLRNWREEDTVYIYKLHKDPLVTHFLYGNWTVEYIQDWIEQMKIRAQHALRVWVIEEKNTKKFIGLIGLDSPDWQASFTPCTEIGWRILPDFWGKGYASEAAKAIIEHAFTTLKLDEIVSFTASNNAQSLRVMEKIGMTKQGDFLHPEIPTDHFLAKNILYRIKSPKL